MSEKQIIYQEILKRGLPSMRLIFSLGADAHELKQALRAELEFFHNLPTSILEPTFVAHDIWFLNNQAKSFFSNPAAQSSPNYHLYAELIRKCFDLLPAELRDQITWPGPQLREQDDMLR